MTDNSGFDSKEYTEKPYLRELEEREGATCLCYQMRIHGKLLFVKKIKPEFQNDSRMRAAFRKENEMGFSLSHPGLPRYIFMEGIFSAEEYVVTEWIEGETLDKFIAGNPGWFTEKDNLASFIIQLSEALDYLHQNGVVHRDVKPQNIMISKDGKRVYIVDLGFAVSDSHRLTGGFSSDFAAPEVKEGREATPASDYYSLGKIIEFITGRVESKFPKGIYALEEATTSWFQENRPQSRQEVEKYLSQVNNGRRNLIYAAASLFILILLGWLVFSTEREEIKPATTEIAEIAEKPPIQETLPAPDTLVSLPKEKTETPSLEKKHGAEEKGSDNPAPVSPAISQPQDLGKLKENLRAEAKERIKKEYVPLIHTIDSLSDNEAYTKENKEFVISRYHSTMQRIFEDPYYSNKYPSLSINDRVGIIGEEHQKFLKEVYNEKMRVYINRVNKVIKVNES